MTVMIAGAAIVVAAGLSAAFFLRPKKEVEVPLEAESVSIGELSVRKQGEPVELVGLADTEEEAEKIAQDYGIELKSYEYGVAVFTTDKSFEEITEIGKTKGLTELSLNTRVKAY